MPPAPAVPGPSTINWISLLASTVVGGLAGYVSAKVQEYQRNRRRLKALAGALRADAERIRSELGAPNKEYVESHPVGNIPAPVAVHRWTEKLITESAEISPALVERFMTLERALGNFNTFRDGLRLTRNTIANLEEGAEAADQEGVAGAGSAATARWEIRKQQDAERQQDSLVVTTRAQAVAALDEIESLLPAYK